MSDTKGATKAARTADGNGILILQIDWDEDVQIGEAIIGLRRVGAGKIKIGILAPRNVRIRRLQRHESPLAGIPVDDRYDLSELQRIEEARQLCGHSKIERTHGGNS